MDLRFGDVHLDPGSDAPAIYQVAFDEFCELWARLQVFRELCLDERFLLALAEHVQRELVVVALVLRVHAIRVGSPGKGVCSDPRGEEP